MLNAITFAEVGCPDLARRFLGVIPEPQPVPIGPAVAVSDFAAAVDLEGVSFHFGLAQAA